MFHPSVYQARRRALLSTLRDLGVSGGLAAFPGNNESPVNYANNAYRFRQDSSFLYFFGVSSPGLAATLDLDTGRTALYADESSIDDLVWTGPVPGAEEWRAAAGVDEFRPRSAFAAELTRAGTIGASAGAPAGAPAGASAGAPAGGAAFGKAAGREGLTSARGVHFLPPYRADTAIELAESLGFRPAEARSLASIALIRAVVALRETKAPEELVEMEKAVDTTIDMHLAVLRGALPGATEAMMAATARGVAEGSGGRASFEPIATTRGDVLHNPRYDGVLASGGLFLLDAGAESAEGYAGDLTTSFPVGGSFDERQKAVYSIVLEAGSAAAAAIRPGTPYLDAHLAAARAVAAGLGSLGVMRGDPDEAVAAGAHACFFPHGVGHQVGLDVHDMESFGEDFVGYGELRRDTRFGFKSLRMAKPLRAGMAVTVEPGVYFIGGLIASWKERRLHEAFIDYAEAERWVGFGGIRNEENWLVTSSGGRRLGKAFDKSIKAIEGYSYRA